MADVFSLDHSHDLTTAEIVSLVGGKAANLGVMAGDLGLPVPPGFAISTEACRQYLSQGWPFELDDEIRRHMTKLERTVGRGFGDPSHPLLVSVRSGAPVSMPGMMDTILNLGLNAETSAGLTATAGADFVEGCFSRFAERYRDIVGTDAPEDPWGQLRGAIEAVFRSWNSLRARSYREREGISDDPGTAVIVQTMVFGNHGDDSATGVVFTRNPATGEADLYGDLIFNAQGEDVVSGTQQTESIAALDERLPGLGAELRAHARRLERHYADVCDIEFTIERGKLWMLQTRIGKRSPQAALRIAVEMAEDRDFPLDRAEAVTRVAQALADPPLAPAGRDQDAIAVTAGLGASPGIAVGAIVTTPEDAVAMAETDRAVLLVRTQTSPDDVHGMAKAAGILTTTGGLASHAATVARGWGIPAVVGAAEVAVYGDAVSIGGYTFVKGDTLSIDGSTGEVFVGAISSGAFVVPEAAKLLAWAAELGIEIPAAGDEREAELAAQVGAECTREAVVHVMSIKGFATAGDLASILFSDADTVSAELDALVGAGLAEQIGGSALAGMFQLSARGKAMAAERIAADRELWGVHRATEALKDLLPLDNRLKVIVTDWQMREVGGQQVLNDHTDKQHDAKVLDEFVFLHEDSITWLAGLSAGLSRLASYASRLDRAAREVASGDTQYLASPRIDSFHNVWFELHEDLIRLAGRTREEEIAAGRA